MLPSLDTTIAVLAGSRAHIVVERGDSPRAGGFTHDRGALRVIAAHDFFVVEKVEPWVRQATRMQFESVCHETRLFLRRQLPRVDHGHGPGLQTGADPRIVAAVLVAPREELAVSIKRMLSGRAQIGNRGGPDCAGRHGYCRGHEVHPYISCLSIVRRDAQRVKTRDCPHITHVNVGRIKIALSWSDMPQASDVDHSVV